MEHRPPAPSDPDETGYQIDDLILDVGQQRVTRAGVDIPLPHLSFALLLTLARAAPNLVTFEQLSAQVWPRLVITPETISQRVKLVRSALGDDPQAPHYITGVRGRGYRMIASVQPLAARQPLPARSAAPPQESSGPAPAPPVPAGAAAAGVPPPAALDGVAGATLPPLRSPLTWITGVAAVLVLLALPWGVTRYLRSPAPVAADARTVTVQPPRTIAVLPLVDVTPGDGNAYLGDGLAQELSARLGRISGLRVASSTSAYSFRDRDKDVRTIAQTLGVRHVLEGSVMREGNQLRVTAQLIDAASGYNVWSQTYNRTWQDLVAIQDDLARSIIGTLRLVLSNELAQRSAQPPTTQVDAFDAYLAGLAMLRGHAGHAELEQAEDNFRRALALDPRFALAYAGLCERFAAGYDATRDAQLVAKAEEACGQALKLDHSLREVSLALAHLYLVSGRDEQAAALYRELIRADPENADGYIGLGEALEGGQHHDDAERAFRQAVEAEPTYWYAQTALGNFLFRQGRSAAAVPIYQRVTELVPASALALNNLGAAYIMTADFPAAAAAFERSLAIEPSRSAYSNLGTVYYFLGRYPNAVRMFTRGTELAAQDHRVWGNLADARWQISASRAEARDDYRRAIALAQRSLAINAKDAVSWMQLAYYSERAGETGEVEHYVERARALGAEDPYVHYYGALVALERGDANHAVEELSHAVELGYAPQLILAAPDFASLRGDARFRKLVGGADKSPQV